VEADRFAVRDNLRVKRFHESKAAKSNKLLARYHREYHSQGCGSAAKTGVEQAQSETQRALWFLATVRSFIDCVTQAASVSPAYDDTGCAKRR
jgi:hypothetical protein